MPQTFHCPNDPDHDQFCYRVKGWQYMDSDGTHTDQDLDGYSAVQCAHCGAQAETKED